MINKKLKIVHKNLLEPFSRVDDNEFERRLALVRMFRQNLLYRLGIKSCKVSEIFPGAIISRNIVGLKIPIWPVLDLDKIFSKSGKIHHITAFDPNAIPIKASDKGKISVFGKRGFMILNAKMSPSFDFCVFHPKQPMNKLLLEAFHFHSSSDVTERNVNISLPSQGVIQKFHKDLEKTEKNIQKFLKDPSKVTLLHVCISNNIVNSKNKRKDIIGELAKDIDFGKHNFGIIFYHNQNFDKFLSIFASKNIFLKKKEGRETIESEDMGK